MATVPPFTLHQPRSVEDASRLLSTYGEDARIIAAGSELVLLLKFGVTEAAHLVDIKRIDGLREVRIDAGTQQVVIGALVTHRAVGVSPIVQQHVPLIGDMARRLGNLRVRNVGTLGGNLCLADPWSDPMAVLVACGATVTLASARGQRHLAVADFCVDAYTTALAQDEILLDVRIPVPDRSVAGVHARFCPWERPTLTAAVLVEGHGGVAREVTLVVGGATPVPLRLLEIEHDLRGKSLDAVVSAASDAGRRGAALSAPTGDVWNSAAYKQHVLQTLISDAIAGACGQVANG